MKNKTSRTITLKDILRFDSLRERFPKKRIKLRFNTSWYDRPADGKPVFRDLLEMYKNGERKFLYGSLRSLGNKGKKRLSDSDIAFQFIELGAGSHQWLLIDAENVISAEFGNGISFEIGNKKWDLAKTERLTEYEPFFGRLVVDWKNKPRQFYYIDEELVDNVRVREIRQRAYLDSDDKFAGFENVCKSYKELKRLINNKDWMNALESVYGVYLITDKKTGKLYVGAAYGDGGIYGRWSVYLKSGYDKDEIETGEYPNKKLKELVRKNGMEYIAGNFQYSILEIFSKSEIGKEKTLKREIYWKEVMQTRLFGYNDN